jgi:hypothetical protein
MEEAKSVKKNRILGTYEKEAFMGKGLKPLVA